MFKAAATALAMIFMFTVAWFVVVPMFDVIAVSLRNVAAEQGIDSRAVGAIDNVINLFGKILAWVGAAGVLVTVIWLLVYAYRREVDTYTV